MYVIITIDNIVVVVVVVVVVAVIVIGLLLKIMLLCRKLLERWHVDTRIVIEMLA